MVSVLHVPKSTPPLSFLREDSLAQMLTMSNVQANSNVIVMETTQGFLTGALLERMGGKKHHAIVSWYSKLH